MSRVPPSARSIVRIALGVSLAAVLLAACGSAAVVTPGVVGSPSISISVPLATVACTTSNSCVAVGTSNATVGPVSVGQYRRPNGQWSPLAVPSVPSSSIASASCWHSQCLVGGSSLNGDVIWRYDAITHSVVSLAAPSGGSDVHALTCYAALSCALVDAGVVGPPRFATTADGGTSWTTPIPIAPASHDTVTGLACASELHCIVAGETPSDLLTLNVTIDGGATWTSLATPPSWTALSSIECRAVHCVALVTTSSGSRFVRSSTFAARWTGTALSGTAIALACTTLSHCVIVGNIGPSAPWLATVHNNTVHVTSLQYVPTPLLSVACGTTICAAIGVTTVLTLTP
jgi:hypothetical protein